MIKKNSFLWMLICTLISCSVYAAEVVDGIAAIVGDKIILRSEWIQTAQGMAIQAGINPVSDVNRFEQLKEEILINLIHNKILYLKADEDTITVEHDVVESELNKRIDGLIQQLGSVSQLEAYFGMPVSQIRRDNRETIKEQLTVQKLQEELLRPVQISRHEVETFFESFRDSLPPKEASVKMRHMLLEVKPGSGTKKKAMAKMEEIRNKLLAGESFESLAEIYSEDPGTAKNGGLLGFVERGMLFQAFDDAAFALAPGEISDVVETPVGLHLIKCEEKQDDKLKLRHILIRMQLSENDETEVLKTIKDLRQRILNGEDFAELARTWSDDPSSRDLGGDLGWLPLNYLQIEEFSQVADTLKVNEVSAVFRTRFGYHFVRMEGKKGAGDYSLKDDWEQIKSLALNHKQQQVMEELVDQLKNEIYIKVAEDIDFDLDDL